jgi:hypothetical protein
MVRSVTHGGASVRNMAYHLYETSPVIALQVPLVEYSTKGPVILCRLGFLCVQSRAVPWSGTRTDLECVLVA